MHNETTDELVYVATDGELMGEVYYRRLWLAVRNIKITRRQWLEELADTFRDYEGKFQYRNKREFSLPCLDEVFGYDADMRWLSYYLRTDNSGDNPKARSRKMLRLRLLDLYFRVKYPHIAEKFKW